MKLPTRDFHELCLRLVESLKESRRFSEAAEILESYMGNSEEAIATLIEGRLWSDANRLIWSHQRPDLRGELIQISRKLPNVCKQDQCWTEKNTFKRVLIQVSSQ